MKIIKTSIFLALFFLSACQIPGAVIPNATQPPASTSTEAASAVPKVTPVCISSEPAQEDIDIALAYTGDLFRESEWQRTYTVSDGRVAVTWFSDALGSVAYLEALIFPCGYEDIDLDNFFNEENWQVIFENYESYEHVAQCNTDDGLRLYEFRTVEQGYDYEVKYWVENDTDTRVLGVMIVFPVESNSLMDDYSSELFPDLTSCK